MSKNEKIALKEKMNNDKDKLQKPEKDKLQAIKNGLPLAKDFVDFMSKSKTTYHTIFELSKLLLGQGFKEIDESKSWSFMEKKGKYFFIRNYTSLFSFVVGGEFETGNGSKIVVAHADSPHLRIKPKGDKVSHGCELVEVTTYGGGIWRTYFDRDLTIAGKVLLNEKGKMVTKLIDLSKDKDGKRRHPLLIIPSLAIHLNTDRTKFVFSKENNLVPVLSSVITKQLNPPSLGQHGSLIKLIVENLDCKIDDIVGYELQVIDYADATLGGINSDLIFSHGLDNKFSCFTGMIGFLNALKSSEKDKYLRIFCAFDHEEIGSLSRSGARTPVIPSIMKRVNKVFKTQKSPKDYIEMSIAKSFVISADNAHAVHPNYGSKHHPKYRPKMNCGIVVKLNINQRYSTNSETFSLLKSIMESQKQPIPYELFQVSNDSNCGTTVGPLTATLTGIRSIDIGTAQWSMHSVRETCGSLDVTHFTRLFEAFYKEFEEKLKKNCERK